MNIRKNGRTAHCRAGAHVRRIPAKTRVADRESRCRRRRCGERGGRTRGTRVPSSVFACMNEAGPSSMYNERGYGLLGRRHADATRRDSNRAGSDARRRTGI